VFDTVLIANRGEIAVRVIRTLRALGCAVWRCSVTRTPALGTSPRPDVRGAPRADRGRAELPEHPRRGGRRRAHPGAGGASRLRVPVERTPSSPGPCASPGWCSSARRWPPSRRWATRSGQGRRCRRAGVRVGPGGGAPDSPTPSWPRLPETLAFPVLLKRPPGCGKGMRLVTAPSSSHDGSPALGGRPGTASADDTLLWSGSSPTLGTSRSRCWPTGTARCWHLGERECSLQAPAQKINRGGTVPLLSARSGRRWARAAVEAARAVGYNRRRDGGVHRRWLERGCHFFMEMTPAAGEHPSPRWSPAWTWSNCSSGWRPASRSRSRQEDVRLNGHAGGSPDLRPKTLARVFLPTGGRVLHLREPAGPRVRVDSCLLPGLEIGGAIRPDAGQGDRARPDRETALRRWRCAVRHHAARVPPTWRSCARCCATPTCNAARWTPGWWSARWATWWTTAIPDPVYAVAALQRVLRARAVRPLADPWDLPGGWRLGEPAWSTWYFELSGHQPRGRAGARAGRPPPRVRGRRRADGLRAAPRRRPERRPAGASYSGCDPALPHGGTNGQRWLGRRGRSWSLTETGRLARRAHRHRRAGSAAHAQPMPGPCCLCRSRTVTRCTPGRRCWSSRR